MKRNFFIIVLIAVFSFSCFSLEKAETPKKDAPIVTNETVPKDKAESVKNSPSQETPKENVHTENMSEATDPAGEKENDEIAPQEETPEKAALSEERVKELKESFRIFATEGAKILKQFFEATSASLEEVIKNLENPSEKESEESTENTLETPATENEQTETDENQEKPEITDEIPPESEEEKVENESSGFTYTKEVIIPPAARPLAPDGEKAAKAAKRDETPETFDKNVEFLQYATSDELVAFIDKKIKEDDPRYGEALYDVFEKNNNTAVRVAILRYFSYLKDPALADFAVTALNEPLESEAEILKALFDYVYEANITQAAPALAYLIQDDMSEYFSPAFRALSKVGEADEAEFLATLLEDEALTLADRQSLMRALGELHVLSTFEKLAECAQDEEENTFVRMYAAEAIGKMKKAEAVEILTEIWAEKNPNLREYCVKGLENFPDSEKAKNVVLESIRDAHYKVRIAAMEAAAKNGWRDATKFIIFRAKNDKEGVVQENAYKTLAVLNNEEGNSFLIDEIKGEKTGDYKKVLAAKALFENGLAENEIFDLTKKALNKKQKYLVTELGKLFIKYAKTSYGEICRLYLSAKDSDTVSLGLALYQNGRYEECSAHVTALAYDTKANSANRNKAKKLMGID